MTVYLRYNKDKIINRDEFLNAHTSNSGYKMLNGTPIIVNIDGSYIKAIDIPDLLVSKKYAKQVNDWLAELKQPIGVSGLYLEFAWRR